MHILTTHLPRPSWFYRVCNEAVDTEIDVELGDFSVRKNRVQLVPKEFGQHPDARFALTNVLVPVDGSETSEKYALEPASLPQCAVVRRTDNVHHVRLLGQRTDLELWTPDPRDLGTEVLGWERPYPDGLLSGETWVQALLDPWARTCLLYTSPSPRD